MNKIKAIILLLLAAVVVSTKAQDNTMTFLKGVPQTTQVNAAFRPVDRWYLAMPALGSIKASGASTGFSWADVSKGDTLNLDYLAGKLQDNNVLATEASLQLIGFGFKVNKTFFTFDLNHRMKLRMGYPSSLLDLRYGSERYGLAQPNHLSSAALSLNTINYSEIAIGASHAITSKIVVGARLKYLMGGINIHSESMDLNFQTFENGAMDMQTNINVNTSAPLVVEYNEDGTIKSIDIKDGVEAGELIINDNNGFAIDLGATWHVINKLTVGAALNDIGFIKWKTNTQQFYSSSTIRYSNLDSTGDDDYLSDVIDNIENTLTIRQTSAYTTGLMGNLSLTADYQFKDWLNVGFMSKNHIVNSKLVPETTLAVAMNPGKALSSVISYSLMKGAPANLGVGLALNAGPLQLYMTTDNLDSLFNVEKAKYFNARMGINFVFNAKSNN